MRYCTLLTSSPRRTRPVQKVWRRMCGVRAAMGIPPLDIAEDAVEIDAMQGAGAIEAGK